MHGSFIKAGSPESGWGIGTAPLPAELGPFPLIPNASCPKAPEKDRNVPNGTEVPCYRDGSSIRRSLSYIRCSAGGTGVPRSRGDFVPGSVSGTFPWPPAPVLLFQSRRSRTAIFLFPFFIPSPGPRIPVSRRALPGFKTKQGPFRVLSREVFLIPPRERPRGRCRRRRRTRCRYRGRSHTYQRPQRSPQRGIPLRKRRRRCIHQKFCMP